MTASPLAWAWVPIVLGAALAQTARNAAQRSLVAQAGTLGATLSRFLYGIPFAALCVALLHALHLAGAGLPPFGASYFAWLIVGATGQLAATAAMLVAMKQRNFVVGAAFSKTDALQVALFASVFLREVPSTTALSAIALATAGVVLLSLPRQGVDRGGWISGAAWWGLASGAGFAFSAIGYRGAALELPDTPAWIIAAWGVLWAQTVQTLLLAGWLAWRSPASLHAILREKKTALIAGGAGAAASLGWFTALALTSAANVRTLGMVEVVFSYLVSRRLQEKLAARERSGLALVGRSGWSCSACAEGKGYLALGLESLAASRTGTSAGREKLRMGWAMAFSRAARRCDQICHAKSSSSRSSKRALHTSDSDSDFSLDIEDSPLDATNGRDWRLMLA